jgi:hypothetical protein
LGIENPRAILMENIRQSCIFKLYYFMECSTPETCGNNILKYWDYMAEFSNVCVDLNNPLFTEKCANLVIEKLNLDSKGIQKCMVDEINQSNLIS